MRGTSIASSAVWRRESRRGLEEEPFHDDGTAQVQRAQREQARAAPINVPGVSACGNSESRKWTPGSAVPHANRAPARTHGWRVRWVGAGGVVLAEEARHVLAR